MERYWRVHLNNTMATARMTLLGNYEAVVVGAGGQRCVNNTRERNYGTMFLNTRAETPTYASYYWRFKNFILHFTRPFIITQPFK